MKAVFFSLLALAASAIAGPVINARQLESEADQLDALMAVVQTHTANLNKTTLAAPENPTLLQQAEYGALLGPDLEAITKALTEATTQFAKRALFGRSTDDDKKGGGKGGSCDKDCLTIKIKWLVWEISCTLKFIIIKLGLGCILIYLTPLIFALHGLIKALDKVVAGVLILVGGLLHSILGALAGGILGLVWV